MSNKTFKKLSVTKKSANFGEAVEIIEKKVNPPEDGQVLVKVLYVGVNAADFNSAAGRYVPDIEVPFDVGFEAMGVIEAIGKNVTTFKVGQPVLFVSFNQGGYSEYLYLSPDELIPIPAIKPEFISLLLSGLTATIGLDQAQIQKGDKVLITAAAGGTGHICVQWAKQKGCHVIGMTSSAEKSKLLKDLGCDRVINYKEESIDDVLTKEYASGVDVIWETIGGQVFETLFKHLSLKGRLIIVGAISAYSTAVYPDVSLPNIPSQLFFGSKSMKGFIIFQYADQFQQYLSLIIKKFLNNELRVVLDLGLNTAEGEFKGIDSVVRGVQHLQSGRNLGKVVIKIQD